MTMETLSADLKDKATLSQPEAQQGQEGQAGQQGGEANPTPSAAKKNKKKKKAATAAGESLFRLLLSHAFTVCSGGEELSIVS